MQVPKYIIVKNATGQTVAFLSPESDGLIDCYVDYRLNGESSLEFKLPTTNEKIQEITPECTIWVNGKVYSLLREDAIDIVRDEHGKLWFQVQADERWTDLDFQYPEPYITNDPSTPEPADLAVIIVGGGSDLSGGRFQVGTAGHALYAVLKGSDWSVGTVDVQGIRDLEMEKVSRLELIKAIQEKWGGYLIFDSVNKIVHLRDGGKWQNYTGFQVRYAKNLKHITRTQSNRIVTKLYPFGHDDLDIAAVNGGKKYITNFSYTKREIVGIYKNPDIYDQQELLERATAELELICRPQYNYKVKIADLRTLPEYNHEDFTVGDMADVIDPNVAPENPRVRILRHKYNVFQPWDCELELGDPQERLVEQLKASFKTSNFIDKTFDSTGKMSGIQLVDASVIRQKIANAAIDASKFDTKQVILTEDVWTDNSPSIGYVSWNSHKLYFAGNEYTIAAGSTNKKYIVWRKSISANTYVAYTESEFANINLADDEFVIAVNNNGIHDVAWYSRIARQFIGSVFIADAAIKTAHIADAAITNAKIGEISANKITSGLLRGIQVQQIASNGTVLADFYKDTNGGKLTLYDNDGDWNVRLGCEGVGGDNVGGTLVLYNNSENKQRAALAIYGAQDCGIMLLYNTNKVTNVYITAAPTPGITLRDSSGNVRTQLTINTGMINNQNIATQNWVQDWVDDNYSPIYHDHDSDYAFKSHTHSQYVTPDILVDAFEDHIAQYHS